jgi:hypothetical protein
MTLDDKQPQAFKNAIGYALCTAGFVLTLVAFLPGLMSPDSVDQWQQGVDCAGVQGGGR